MKRDEREARALHFLSRELKIGTEFCVAFMMMTRGALQQLENDAANAYNASEPRELYDAWQHTLSQFRSRQEDVDSRCDFIEDGIPEEEKNLYRGALAPMRKCIHRVNLRTVKAFIADQYKEEEESL
jgi:hypothetical protein